MRPAPTTPSVRPREPEPHVVHALVPASGTRQPILEEQLAGECKDERERGRGDGTRHRARRVGHEHAGARHCVDVDRVVADAVPRDDAQPAIRARDRGRRNTRGVHVQRVVRRRVVGVERRNDLRQIVPGQRGSAVENLERRAPERRFAAAVEDVAGDADAKRRAHRESFPRTRGGTQLLDSPAHRFLEQQMIDAVRHHPESALPEIADRRLVDAEDRRRDAPGTHRPEGRDRAPR